MSSSSSSWNKQEFLSILPHMQALYVVLLVVSFVSLSPHSQADAAKSFSPRSSIPRSTNARSIYSEQLSSSSTDTDADTDAGTDMDEFHHRHHGQEQNTTSRSFLPPWNPSPNIDQDGFLTWKYRRIHGDWEFEDSSQAPPQLHPQHESNRDSSIVMARSNTGTHRHVIGGKFQSLEEPVYIRQVPGDGNCLFHSLSVGLALLVNQTHVDMNSLSTRRRRRTTTARIRKHSSQHSRLSPPPPRLQKQRGRRRRNSTTRQTPYHHDLKHLHYFSKHLRLSAVQVLSRHPRRLLFLQGNEYLRARDLVTAAAEQYGLTPEEYCDQMKKDSYWGGGPEIVALCNYLQRPIHVYELMEDRHGEDIEMVREDSAVAVSVVEHHHHHQQQQQEQEVKRRMKWECNPHFRLRRMACFGSPKFDNKEALHILSADSRFPDIEPGKQLSSGNHFLVMFPERMVLNTMGNIGCVMDNNCDEYDEDSDAYDDDEQRNHLRGGDAGDYDDWEKQIIPSGGRERCSLLTLLRLEYMHDLLCKVQRAAVSFFHRIITMG